MKTTQVRKIFVPILELHKKAQSEIDKTVKEKTVKGTLSEEGFNELLTILKNQDSELQDKIIRILCLSIFLKSDYMQGKREVYELLAHMVAQLGPNETELDFLEYLRKILKDQIVLAMCDVVWYNEELEIDFDTFKASHDLLKKHKLDEHFLVE